MPYFLAVLRDLTNQERHPRSHPPRSETARGQGAFRPLPPEPPTPVP
jgi:hypothetical protein